MKYLIGMTLLLSSLLTSNAFAGKPCDQFLNDGGDLLNGGSCIDGSIADKAYKILADDANVAEALRPDEVNLMLKNSIEFRIGPNVPGQVVQLGSLCRYYFSFKTNPNLFVTHVDLTDSSLRKLAPMFKILKVDTADGDTVVCARQKSGVACYESTYGISYQCE
jgi:hypothetical protein